MKDPYDDDGQFMIRLRFLRQELELPDLSDDDQAEIQRSLDRLVAVPIELHHIDRVRELTDDQLLRLWKRHQPEDELLPLPAIESWDSDDLPSDRKFVMIDHRVTWKGGGPAHHRGRVWVHVADGSGDGVGREFAEESFLEAKIHAVEIAVEEGLGKVYARRVTSMAS